MSPRAAAPFRLLLVSLALLALGVAGIVVLHGRAEAAAVTRACRSFAHERAARLRELSGSGRPITVIGDSWSVGHRLARPSRSWPSQLSGRVTVDGFSGSGFSAHASRCGASFATRTASARGAGLVVVEGGLNDYDQTEAAVAGGFDALIGRLAGHRILVVGPAPAPSRLSGARRVDSWLATLCDEAAVPYLSTIGVDLPYLPDGLHLTAAGHRQFGEYVAAHLP